MIALLVTAVLFTGTGYAATRLLAPQSGTVAERFGAWFLAGLVACGFTLFALSVAGLPFGRGIIITTMLIGLGAAALVTRSDVVREPIRYPRAATAFAAVPVAALLVASFIVPLNDYDGRAFWLLKARAIAREKAVDGDFFHGRSGYDPRNRYPLLVPLDAAAVYSVLGDDDDRNARWLFAFTGISFLLVLRREIGRRVSPAIGAWTVAVLAWTPQILLAPEGSALSAYADVALAAFSAAAFFAMLDGSWRSFGLWLCGAVLTKNEGLAIAAIMIGVAVLLHGRSVFTRRFGFSLAGITIAVGLLLFWQHGIPPGDEHNLPGLVLTLPARMGRLPSAAGAFLRHWGDVAAWGLLWPAFAAACVFPATAKTRAQAIAIAFCATLSVAYVITYAVSPWSVQELAATSANRLLLHMAGPAAFVVASALQEAVGRQAKA